MVITSNPNRHTSIDGVLEYHNGNLENLISELESRGYTSCIIAGGSSIYSEFMKRELVDEMYLTITPNIFSNGIPIFRDIDKQLNIKSSRVKKLTKKNKELNEYQIHYII